MIFKCQSCAKNLSVSYHTNPDAADEIMEPWYRDESGIQHSILCCLRCGAIHDLTPNIFKGLIFIFNRNINPMNVFKFSTKEQLTLMLDNFRDFSKSETIIAVEKLGIPRKSVNAMVKKRVFYTLEPDNT